MRGIVYLWLAALLAACRPHDEGGYTPAAGSAAEAGAAASAGLEAEPAAGAGGQPAPVSDAAHGAEGELEAEPPLDPGCQGETVSLEEVHAGAVRERSRVVLRGLLASSQKFLLSEAKSGSCLWAAFAAAPARVGAGSGLLLVSYGDRHAAEQPCASGTDGLPDDLAVGDVLDVPGVVTAFAPAACAETAPAVQLRVDATCPLVRTGRAEPPEPALIDLALAERLAEGRDRALLRAWGSALVTLRDVSAERDPEDGDAVFPFGVVKLAQTSLPLSSRVHYFDLSAGGPRAASKAPRYPYPSHFDDVSGVLLLDYCSWSLAPRGPLTAGP